LRNTCIAKLNVMNSTIGFSPRNAAPTPRPVNPACRSLKTQDNKNSEIALTKVHRDIASRMKERGWGD
jgi:hypothetical protein